MTIKEALRTIKENRGFYGCMRALTKENEAFHIIEDAIINDKLTVRRSSKND